MRSVPQGSPDAVAEEPFPWLLLPSPRTRQGCSHTVFLLFFFLGGSHCNTPGAESQPPLVLCCLRVAWVGAPQVPQLPSPRELSQSPESLCGTTNGALASTGRLIRSGTPRTPRRPGGTPIRGPQGTGSSSTRFKRQTRMRWYGSAPSGFPRSLRQMHSHHNKKLHEGPGTEEAGFALHPALWMRCACSKHAPAFRQPLHQCFSHTHDRTVSLTGTTVLYPSHSLMYWLSQTPHCTAVPKSHAALCILLLLLWCHHASCRSTARACWGAWGRGAASSSTRMSTSTGTPRVCPQHGA